MFVLNFRGLSFYFPIDSKFQPGYAHGLGSLQFPNGTSPLVSKTAIYVGNMAGGSGSDEHNLKTPPPPLPLVIIFYRYYSLGNTRVKIKGQKLKMFLIIFIFR